ncbi:MAG: methylmalonyl-CoA epimerase [Gemmatimonadota bacterium]|nr:methylmalonyl-CoA epimerase [Gemmatimonadota bacterium]
MTVRLAHIGIAVHSIPDARNFYEEVLGLSVESIEDVESEGVRVAMLPFPGGEVELLEPLGEDTPVGRFLAKHGEGLHHVSFDVPDVQRTILAGIEHGVETVGDAPRTGAEGRPIAFFHPLFTHGVLVEIAGPRPDDEGSATARELRALGRRLGDVLDRAWEGEERKKLQDGVRTGLRSLVDEVDESLRKARESRTAERARDEAREVGRKARGGMVESLRWLSAELGELARRVEDGDESSAQEQSADAS